jgi:hypothetical protein
MAQALGRSFMAYDASKSLFEDVLGFPNVESLRSGRVEYVPSAVTIWDKEFVLIDEINRALPELQAKWLEIIRSRRIMGFPTAVKWVWSAMNPSDDSRYNGTQVLDAALVGRFATFLYPPEALDMEEGDRIRVVQHINGDDAPSLSEWLGNNGERTVTQAQTLETGSQITGLLQAAAGHFAWLRDQLSTLGEFLSRFSVLVLKETEGKVKLDGRRLGFMYRNLLAYRSIELAQGRHSCGDVPDLARSAKTAIMASIPIGISRDGINREETLHKVEICLDLLADYFRSQADMVRTERIYRLFTCKDLLEKTRILLREDLSDLAKAKAWNDLMGSKEDVTILAYVALQVEAHRPGTVPTELMEKISGRVIPSSMTTELIPRLKGESVELIDEVESLLDQPDDLARVVAYHRLRERLQDGRVTRDTIAGIRQQIDADAAEFASLLRG